MSVMGDGAVDLLLDSPAIIIIVVFRERGAFPFFRDGNELVGGVPLVRISVVLKPVAVLIISDGSIAVGCQLVQDVVGGRDRRPAADFLVDAVAEAVVLIS